MSNIAHFLLGLFGIVSPTGKHHDIFWRIGMTLSGRRYDGI